MNDMAAEAEAAVRSELGAACVPQQCIVTGPLVTNQLRSWSVRVVCKDGTEKSYEYRKRIGSEMGVVWAITK
ncbi:MAG TPA: hypothetical protein VGQ57_04420 [Polyangiaceae bacterium]|jgi:hypothetical protein|nr:hypothetical protein [Polyangiaceae bacterium]